MFHHADGALNMSYHTCFYSEDNVSITNLQIYICLIVFVGVRMEDLSVYLIKC